MRLIRKFLRKIWGAWFYLNWAFWFLPLLPFFMLFLSHPAMYKYAHFCRRIWGYILFSIGLMPMRIHFEQKLSRKKKYVVVPNHSSYLDIPATTCFLPFGLSYMAKAELSKIPIFGRFFHTIDISVDRKSSTASHKAFLKAAELLKHGRRSLVVFPEGTISKKAPRLGKFKNGPFKLAIEQECEILPITFTRNWKCLPDDGSWEAQPGLLYMHVHRPIPTVGLNMENVEELKQKVFSIIEKKLEEHESNG